MNNRIIKIGDIETGKNNNICDVPGVLVGHVTIDNEYNHTGITSILPHQENLFLNKVVAGAYAYNGYGKSMGLVQVEELGTIETPILLTNTLSIGKVSDGLISYMLDKTKKENYKITSINPIVMECNDSRINDIEKRILNDEDVNNAINNASTTFLEGNVGAGTGMVCHGFKGGIGSSSRVIQIDNVNYTVGVLVNTNFGSSNGEDLIIKGRKMKSLIKNYSLLPYEDKGSIIIIVATDLPLDSRQLKRVAKRTMLGVAKTGSYSGNGSGDIALAFSTKNKVNHNNSSIEQITRFPDNIMNKCFKAVVDATEEAVLNSMLYANGVTSYDGTYYKSINEYKILFEDLLEKKDY